MSWNSGPMSGGPNDGDEVTNLPRATWERLVRLAADAGSDPASLAALNLALVNLAPARWLADPGDGS